MKNKAIIDLAQELSVEGESGSRFESAQGFKEALIKADSSNYETKGGFSWLIGLSLIWLLTIWVIFKRRILRIKGKTNSLWFDGLSTTCRYIKEKAASWQALDIVYNFQFGEQNGLKGKISDYWLKINNAQAVRNRLRLVREELIRAIEEFSRKKKEVRLLSIASGSAQAVIEAMTEAKKKGIKVKAVFLDIDPTAIEFSQAMAKKHGLEESVVFVRGNTKTLENAINGDKPHIIEMIGFLDYRPETKAIRLVRKIYDLLSSDGLFLTGNICPNSEQYFMKWVVDWPMIHRKPEGLRKIIVAGGFDPADCRIILEPLKIHALALCRKLV